LEPPLCVVSSWIIRVYTILVWNTVSGSTNLDNCFYHCLILISISHLKALFIIIIIIITTSSSSTTTSTSTIIIVVVVVVVVVVVLLLFIIYIVNFHVVRPRSCLIIYYFDTPTLGRRHQLFGRVRHGRSQVQHRVGRGCVQTQHGVGRGRVQTQYGDGRGHLQPNVGLGVDTSRSNMRMLVVVSNPIWG